MKIKVTVRNVYGVDRIYPVTNIEPLQALTGQKTLSKDHIKALESLGFTIEVEAPTL